MKYLKEIKVRFHLPMVERAAHALCTPEWVAYSEGPEA